jgi:hypothetical protein
MSTAARNEKDGDDEQQRRPEPVEISVNHKPVAVPDAAVTGLQIKQAAIAQGLKIELSFQLSEELGPRQTRIVGNDEIIHVHEGSKFLAVHGDDNS